MKQITTLTQLGARVSVARRHIQRLEAVRGPSVNHVLYNVDTRNRRLFEYAKSLAGPYSVYDQSDNDWLTPSMKKRTAFGSDFNYDYLIRRPETGDVFLTLHDDSLIVLPEVWDAIRGFTDEYHFGGYVDTRGVPQYEHLYLDGVPMSKLRIGTWFCFGRKQHYLERGYQMADFQTYFKWTLYWKFRTLTRLRADGIRVWLNGGFDLNIRARLDGDRFAVLDDMNVPVYAEHWNKITGFFVKRNLLRFADTPEEVAEWTAYLRALRARNVKQFDFDVAFLGRLADELSEAGIDDPLLNPDQVAEFGRIS